MTKYHLEVLCRMRQEQLDVAQKLYHGPRKPRSEGLTDLIAFERQACFDRAAALDAAIMELRENV